MRESFPRATREKERRPNPAFRRNLWRASPGLCAKKDGRASRQKAEPFFSSGLLCFFFVPLSLPFPRGRRAGRGFSCFFLRPPGESVFFRIKTGTAFRGGRIPERAFPANRFSLFQTHRLRPHPKQKVIQARKNGEKSGERRRQGPLRRPEPFGDRGKKTDKKKGNQKRQKQVTEQELCRPGSEKPGRRPLCLFFSPREDFLFPGRRGRGISRGGTDRRGPFLRLLFC